MGNPHRIKKVLEKSEKGEDVVLAFLGGSITQGSLSSWPASCYAYRVYQWWDKTFPGASFTYINAGIGGTTSLFGVSRVQEDILKYKPDFIMIDFTVNDENSDFFMETYESLIKRILSSSTPPAVAALCNVFYENGKSAFEKHEKILKHYEIPYVSMEETLFQDICGGRIKLHAVTPDGLHPNDTGHQIIADLIIDFLEEVRAAKPEDFDEEWEKSDPPPITECRYVKAERLQNMSGAIRYSSFKADLTPKNGVTDVFHGGWTGFKKGDSILIETEGSCLDVQYRRSVSKPAPVAAAYLDGDRQHGVVLDGNFNKDWGDCLAITPLLHHGRPGKHEIEIEIMKGVEEQEIPFYLVSIIQSGDL